MAGNGKKIVDAVIKLFVEGGGFDRVMEKMRIVSAGEGRCVAEMMVDKEHQNKGGTLHGGMTATLVDIVSTLALMTKDRGVPGVSVNMNITYLKSAKQGDEIVINANTLKTGKNLAFLEVEITNKATGNIIATGSHTKFVGS
ncbi:acyl-coenzyme A thioesterase 13 [Anabrus simplex]|uniref:acyl-coenzyme A thioesterase 13 n=1 Tax=Anabrus simplex TaxID=316456 RepID=UPI0035A3718D